MWYSPEHGIDWLELSSGTREDLRGVGEDPSYPTPMNFVIVGNHGTVQRMDKSSIDGSLYFAAVSGATTANITHMSRDSDWVLSDEGHLFYGLGVDPVFEVAQNPVAVDAWSDDDSVSTSWTVGEKGSIHSSTFSSRSCQFYY